MLVQGVVDELLKENGIIGLERRQVCYKPMGAAAFLTTGLTLTVQNLVLGLEINGVRNKRGLHPVLPRAQDVQMTYFRRASMPRVIGDSFAIVRPDAECPRLCQTSLKPTCAVAGVAHEHAPSGFLSAHTNDGRIGTVSCLKKAGPNYDSANRAVGDISCDLSMSLNPDISGMAAGRYKLCFRAASSCTYFSCWPIWAGINACGWGGCCACLRVYIP